MSTSPSPAPITVYSTPSCVQCTATYRTLDKLGLSYEVVDLSGDDDARDMVQQLGHRSAPVVIHGADHWSGFRPDLLAASAKRLRAA